MNKYEIRLRGCDDSTYLNIELTQEQVELIEKICEMSRKESTYECMPTMSIKLQDEK